MPEYSNVLPEFVQGRMRVKYSPKMDKYYWEFLANGNEWVSIGEVSSESLHYLTTRHIVVRGEIIEGKHEITQT